MTFVVCLNYSKLFYALRMKTLSLVSKTEVEWPVKVASSIVEVAVVGQKVLSQGWVKSDNV